MRIVFLTLLALVAGRSPAAADPGGAVESRDIGPIAHQAAADLNEDLIPAADLAGGRLRIAVRPYEVDEVADGELAERLNKRVEAELQAGSARRFTMMPRDIFLKVQQEVNEFQSAAPSQAYLEAIRRYNADVLVVGTLAAVAGGYDVFYQAYDVRPVSSASAHTRHDLKILGAGGAGSKDEALFRAAREIARRLRDIAVIPSPHFDLSRDGPSDPAANVLLDAIEPILSRQIEFAAGRAIRFGSLPFNPSNPIMHIAISVAISGSADRSGSLSARFVAKLPDKMGQAAAVAVLRLDDVGPAATPQPPPVVAARPVPPPPAPVAPEPAPPPSRLRECARCPEMVLIPAGTFQMGVPLQESRREGTVDDDADARPVHPVRIGQDFYLGKYHVTRGEYAAFAAYTGRIVVQPFFAQTDEHPVVNVNWDDAQAYVAWLSRSTGKPYRLPTEAEWEYAARGGTTTARYWGDSSEQQCRFANGADLSIPSKELVKGVGCRDGYVYTSPVGRFGPNRFELYDMLGNAWQLVQDCYDESRYRGASSQGAASCSSRVVRGGSWNISPERLRSGYRTGVTGTRKDNIGFRVARTLTTTD